MPGHHHHHKQDKEKGKEKDPEQKSDPKEQQAGEGGEKKEEGGAAAAGGDKPKYAESWQPPTMDVHTPASGDTYAAEASLAVNFEVASEVSKTCKAHFALHKDGKLLQTAEEEEVLKDHHARDVIELTPETLGGAGKFELHYWVTDQKNVESPIKKIQFEVVDESNKEEKAPAGAAAQPGEPDKGLAPL